MTDTKPAQTPENPFSRMAARLSLDETRAAGLLGVSVHTWRKWATGQRQASASALRLLDFIALMETLAPDMLKALIPEQPVQTPKRKPKTQKDPL